MAVTSSVEPAVMMRPLLRRCVAFAPLLILVLLVSDQNISARPRMPVNMPPLVLWAWDRDDDLSFIDIRDTAVAYLAATVILRGNTVFLPPRHHPLAPPKGTRLVAVAHVEVDRHEPPEMSDLQARAFAETLAALRETRPGEFLQIDFEAKASQRDFFVKAVAVLRQRLPNAVLSATAFTSWCLNERWTQSLAVDEVVPMLFRLGPDRRRIRDYFAGGDFRSANCRTSIGVATDELPAAIP